MRTRKLGQSGIEVPEIGLGTWGLSGEAYGPVDPGVARAVIETALGAGATVIETAGCYGPDGAVEKLVGTVLKDRGRDSAFVVTRIGLEREPTGYNAYKRFKPGDLRRLTEAALKRLQTDHVDTLLLHNPLVETIAAADVMSTLVSLRHKGLARTVGISAGSEAVALAAMKHDIDVIEIGYNLLYPQLLHAIAAEVSEHRVGVIARSPLAYGLLAGTWGTDKTFEDDDHRADRWGKALFTRRIRQREAARTLVKGPITTLSQAALRWVLANQLVTVTVPGARTPEMAFQNAHAADELPYLSDEDLGAIAVRMHQEGVEN